MCHDIDISLNCKISLNDLCAQKSVQWYFFTGKVLPFSSPFCFSFIPFSFPFSFSFPLKRRFPFFRGGGLASLLKGIFLIRWLERFIKCVVYGYLFSTCVFWLPKRMAEPQAKRLSAPVRWFSMTETSSRSPLIGSQSLLSFLPFASRSCELNRRC